MSSAPHVTRKTTADGRLYWHCETCGESGQPVRRKLKCDAQAAAHMNRPH